MAKSRSAPLLAGRQALSPLARRLLLAASERNGQALRPYPEGLSAEEIEAAIAELRGRGFAHGPAREPNLTQEGAWLAQDQAAEDLAEASAKAAA